jgi:hypothetical protein
MIKIEDCIFATPEQIEFVIMGMRNPMNSWSKSDSKLKLVDELIISEIHLGEADLNLMQRLSKAGSEHRKYLRMLPVWCNITAPLYWWKEFDTYKIGTVSNSCSTMHKIAEKEFTLADFSIEHLNDDRSAELSNVEWLEHLIHHLNRDRLRFIETKDKQYWWQMIQLLPSSYNQKRSIFMNGEVLLNIYNQRWGHKLDEWREVCFFIEDCPYWDFIERGVFKKVKGE